MRPIPDSPAADGLAQALADAYRRLQDLIQISLPPSLERQGAVSALKESEELAIRAAREAEER